MFPARYFPSRYFAPRYWPKAGRTLPIYGGLELARARAGTAGLTVRAGQTTIRARSGVATIRARTSHAE